MKSKLKLLTSLMILLILSFSNHKISAQSMGISSTSITPDPSSILEMRTTTKGVLIPRMTTAERDLISLPANGLMIYNTSTSRFNFYNGSTWVVLVSDSSAYLSVDAGSTLTTSSTSDVAIADMNQTAPETATYLVLFNGQVSIPAANNTETMNTATLASDLNLIYTDIMAIPATSSTHPLVFGSGETLSPGVYDIAGAASIAGTLTLDGGGDPNALFAIRATGAFNTGSGVTVALVNGATAKNVFWVADGAIGLGASTTIQGTLFSHGSAIAVGATCTVTGRLLTTLGAISFGEGTISLPTDSSDIDFRSLSNFVIFTSSGGIANTGASIYTGDIASNAGAITGFGTATVNGTIYQSGTTTTVTTVNHMATFSLYKNGILIPNSSRTRTHLLNPSDISLQGTATVNAGEVIDVRWKVDTQDSDNKEISVINRILTLIKVGN
tara:strand:+ start:3764 stop:5089 length:1326 start_codon:yes stop_codon:yes gene_type:complete